MNLLLIGPRGCGKTTVGKLLAARCKRPFVDLDDRVVRMFDRPTVVEIWQVHGEAAWRSAETAAFAEVLTADQQVIALGGGAPMIHAVRQMIGSARQNRSATVVYLRVTAAVLTSRLRPTPGDRPSLIGGDPIAEIPRILAAREPTYLDLADLVYDAGTESAADVAEGILDCLPPAH